MRASCSVSLVVLALALVGGSRRARADEAGPPAPLTDEELLRLAEEEGEVITVFDERPEKPFDRDTELRLTGAELAARGATDLATALALLPDVTVRDVGRGGFNVDIRGARKGAVRVLVDGVAVSDPYYGTFDVSTIPVTDIEQIRVSTSPASPIDGPGGPGGVIEVHTRDALGAKLVVARFTGASSPTFGASATGRVIVSPALAVRLSVSSLLGGADFDTPAATVEDHRRATTGALRVEHRAGRRRVVVDGFVDDRRYVSPPSDELATALILLIDRETTARLGAGVDQDLGADRKLQVQARGWVHALTRLSRNFRDAALTDQVNAEDLSAVRAGALALATRPLGRFVRAVASVTVDHERARVDNLRAAGTETTRGDATVIESALGGQLERGRVEVDGAIGVAVPAGIGADPWPEAKLAVQYRLLDELTVEAIGARKGRVPTLRERFAGTDANAALAPELASHGELRATARPADGFELVAAGYYRRTTGTVKVDPADGMGLINLGELTVRGVDVRGEARLHARLDVGGSYGYARADSHDLGPDPIDRFPRHRADGWVRGTPRAGLTALVRARHAGAAVDRGLVIDGYQLWEASLSATLRGDWLGVLRCDDLLDARPETRDGYHLPGRVVTLTLQGTWD